jgi:hypothetical protein
VQRRRARGGVTARNADRAAAAASCSADRDVPLRGGLAPEDCRLAKVPETQQSLSAERSRAVRSHRPQDRFRLHWCVCLRKHKRNSSQRQFSARLRTACRRTVLLLCVVRTGVPRLRCGGAQWTAALVHTGGVLAAYAVSAERRPSVEVPTGTYRALCGNLYRQWKLVRAHTRPP